MTIRKSAFALAAGLVLLQCSFVCSQPKQLTILHTNDLHASFLPHEAGWIRTEPKPMAGGFHELARLIDSLRSVDRDLLLLDGGDVMTGSPISDFEYKGSVGGALFEMMNLIGYDAWAVGNHDLDVSQENLKALIAVARFPSLSANLVDSAGTLPLGNKEYVILEKQSLRIGVIGLITRDLFGVTNTNNLKGLKVLPPAEVTQAIIDKIDAQTDLIVAVTHQGVDEDSALARNTHGLDVIIGGHSHTRLRTPKRINNVIIVQAGSNSENLGVLKLTVEHDSVKAFSGELLSLWPHADGKRLPVDNLIHEYKGKIESEYGEIIGKLGVDWKRNRGGESNIGTFIAEAIREGCSADVAVTNSSGIRKDVSAGNIRKLDLFEIAPFHNYLSTFKITGRDLRALVLRHLQSLSKGQSPIQFSGLQCQWRRNDTSVEIVSLRVKEADVTDEQIYTFGTTDFVIDQADKYLGFNPGQTEYTKITMYQALLAKVGKDRDISGILSPNFKELH